MEYAWVESIDIRDLTQDEVDILLAKRTENTIGPYGYYVDCISFYMENVPYMEEDFVFRDIKIPLENLEDVPDHINFFPLWVERQNELYPELNLIVGE